MISDREFTRRLIQTVAVVTAVPHSASAALVKVRREKVMSLVMLVLQQVYVYLQKFQFDHNLASNGFDFVTVYFGQANRACD